MNPLRYFQSYLFLFLAVASILVSVTHAKRKVLLQGVETEIEMEDQTIHEVFVKRIKEDQNPNSTDVLIHKISIDSKGNDTRAPPLDLSRESLYPYPIFSSPILFQNFTSDLNDTLANETWADGDVLSGRFALGIPRFTTTAFPLLNKGRGLGRDAGASKAIDTVKWAPGDDDIPDCEDDAPWAEKNKTCWSKEEFNSVMQRIRHTVTNNVRPCPESLPCKDWSSCLYLWPTGLIDEKLRIDIVGEQNYFDLLYEGLNRKTTATIREFMRECYEIYGLREPFTGGTTGRRRKRAPAKTIHTGVSNCRARILDLQECLGYGVWKVICSNNEEFPD